MLLLGWAFLDTFVSLKTSLRKSNLKPDKSDRNPAAEDDRSSAAKAMAMVGSITAISMSMVVMALIGWGLDTWLGTQVVFMFIGVLLGMIGGVWQLTRMLTPKSER